MKTKQNKLRTYLTVTAGAGCAASVASGSVVFYGVDAANDTNQNPNDLLFRAGGDYNSVGFVSFDGAKFGVGYNGMTELITFSRGSDLVSPYATNMPIYEFGGSFNAGAVSGDQNYANIDFDGDGIYEAVAQFNFDGLGGGFLVAIATNNDVDEDDPTDLSQGNGAALSVSEGVDLINAASVPEPSSLSLLALGAAGLVTRRNRKKAA